MLDIDVRALVMRVTDVTLWKSKRLWQWAVFLLLTLFSGFSLPFSGLVHAILIVWFVSWIIGLLVIDSRLIHWMIQHPFGWDTVGAARASFWFYLRRLYDRVPYRGIPVVLSCLVCWAGIFHWWIVVILYGAGILLWLLKMFSCYCIVHTPRTPGGGRQGSF